jgi:hypothetical protein
MFSTVPAGDMNKISVFFTYNINDVNRHAALDLKDIFVRPEEKEILISRYVPFTIRSVKETDDGRKLTIYCDECKEQCTVGENHF